MWVLGIELGPLKEQPVHLTAEQSLQLPPPVKHLHLKLSEYLLIHAFMDFMPINVRYKKHDSIKIRGPHKT